MPSNLNNKYNFNKYNKDLLKEYDNYGPYKSFRKLLNNNYNNNKKKKLKLLILSLIIISTLYWIFTGKHNITDKHSQDFLLPNDESSLETTYITDTSNIEKIQESEQDSDIDSDIDPDIESDQNQEITQEISSDIISKNIIIQKNDNIYKILQKYNINSNLINTLTLDQKASKYLKNIKPGERLIITYHQNTNKRNHNLTQLKYFIDKFSYLNIDINYNTDNNFNINSSVQKLELQTRTSYKELNITSSLFEDAQKQNVPLDLIYQIIDIFTWDIDFAEDLRANDKVEILYQQYYLNGELYTNGHIEAVNFYNNGKTYNAIRYEDSNKRSNYYTAQGLSLKKAFIRTPVKFTRISSRFNLNRKHPVLHRIRAHRGVDYAAPTGTPIKAAGDGKITYYGRKGGYGKTAIIQHGKKYSTLYAHMSRYNPKLKKGHTVKQGDLIGYVGQTGLASGPHLHFEFRINNVHVNPLTVKLPSAKPINNKDKKDFVNHANTLLNTIKLQSQIHLASKDQDDEQKIKFE